MNQKEDNMPLGGPQSTPFIKNRNTNLDIVRIFAALMVLSVHIGQSAGFDFSVGAKGVQLFFVLSGYLTIKSFSRETSTLDFYKKRAKRILPTYYVCLILLYLEDLLKYLLWDNIGNAFIGQCGPRFIRYFFFLQTILPSDNWNMWNNHGALWTMSCFAFFYAVVPLLSKLLNNFNKTAAVTIIAMLIRDKFGIFIQKIFSGYGPEAHIEWFAYLNPLSNLYCFLIGMLIYYAIKENREKPTAFVMLLVLIVTDFSWYKYELLFGVLIVLSIIFPPLIIGEKASSIIKKISGETFALYLVHPMVLAVVVPVYTRLFNPPKTIPFAITLYLSAFFATFVVNDLIINKIRICLKLDKSKVAK